MQYLLTENEGPCMRSVKVTNNVKARKKNTTTSFAFATENLKNSEKYLV